MKFKQIVKLAVFMFSMFVIGTELPRYLKNREAFAKEKARLQNENDKYYQLRLFGEAFELMMSRYVDEVSPKKLIEGAIDGMLSKQDPHSTYLNAEDFTSMTESTQGEFGGLGIEVTMDKGVVRVISPMDDTPAFRAGIQAGDLITHIDDTQVYGLSLSEAIKKMKGRPGTKVKLKIFREGKEPFDLTLTRAIIKVDAVRHRIRGGNVGYIRLSTFNENTHREMLAAIRDIKKRVKEPAGFVVDLRNNTGGLLEQAVRVSDSFITSGQIVSIKSRTESANRMFFANGDDILNGLPIVVLINGGSASASEIVAGALQDSKRAVIMGTKSYGKGSVQTLIPIDDGALKITTARYYTPSGRSIQADGIVPDIEVGIQKIEEVKEDRTFSEETLANAMRGDGKQKTKSREQMIEERDEADYQLKRAVDMVKGLYVFYRTSPAKEKPATPAKAKK
ncbi:MAG: S41 family peptidase [Alphaproteobacteria bacterium]|nr:S41 family peptidase [Alphaproteobacteria bacterium]